MNKNFLMMLLFAGFIFISAFILSPKTSESANPDRSSISKSISGMVAKGEGTECDEIRKQNDLETPHISFTAPGIINSSNQNAVPITGNGTPNVDVHYQVFGGMGKMVSGSVPADPLGNFNFTLDLSSFPDGTIDFTVFQNGECESNMAFQKAEKNSVIPPSPDYSIECKTGESGQPLINISGTTVADGTIEYVISDGENNDISGSAKADSSGNFSVSDINISGLLFNISVCLSATDSFGNTSPNSCKNIVSCAEGGRGGGSLISTTIPVLPATGPDVKVYEILALLTLAFSLYFRLRKRKVNANRP